MSTVFRIAVAERKTEKKMAAAESAFDEIDRLEKVLSEWIPESEISRVNQGAGGAPVDVGPDTYAVVNAGIEVSKWSGGAFDLSWAALRGVYTFTKGAEELPTRAFLRKRLPLVDWRKVRVQRFPPPNDSAKGRSLVQLERAGMLIGTGGIAKGYALDRAGEILRAAGIANYMLYAGGQVQVRGKRGGRHWRVGIQHPRRNDYFAYLEVRRGSLATSGDYEHFFIDERGKRWHHIIDLKDGLPARGVSSVTFVAERGIYADALSTASFVMGPKKATKLCESLPFEAAFVIVDSDGRLHLSKGAEGALVMNTELLEGNRLPGF